MDIEITMKEYDIKVYNRDIVKAKVFLKNQTLKLPNNDKDRLMVINKLSFLKGILDWEGLQAIGKRKSGIINIKKI